MNFSEEKLQQLSLSDLIALKGYLLNDCINHWNNLLANEEVSSPGYLDYLGRIELCTRFKQDIEDIITGRLHELVNEFAP